jgi:hypothetical protein
VCVRCMYEEGAGGSGRERAGDALIDFTEPVREEIIISLAPLGLFYNPWNNGISLKLSALYRLMSLTKLSLAGDN